MEARSFFENSPMAEITVTATKEEWRQILNELRGESGWTETGTGLVNLLVDMGVGE